MKLTHLLAGSGLLMLAPMLHAQEVGAATQAATQSTHKSFLDSLDFAGVWQANSPMQWGILLGAIFVGLLIGKTVSLIIDRAAERIIKRGWEARGCAFESAAGPVNLFIFTLLLSIGLSQLELSEFLIVARNKALILLYSATFFWFAFNLVSVIEVWLKRVTAKTESTLDDQLVPIFRKALRVFLCVIGLLFILQNVFERDIGAWLAGLGIAGLAVSLAAQDSLKNLFGSITIFLDRPFLLNDVVKFQSYQGTVEEIGFRSTKVRTVEGALLTVPNSIIVYETVENLTARPSVRRILDVTVTYDTPPEKLQEAKQILTDLVTKGELAAPINGNPKQPPRVFFSDMKADSLNIRVWYWFQPSTDYWAYMDHSDKINMAILDRFNKAGIAFAFPTQTLFVAGDPKYPLHVAEEKK